MGSRARSLAAVSLGVAVAVVAAACSSGSGGGGGSSGASPSSASGSFKVSAPKHGGSITVLEGKGYAGDWPYGFDPATNVDDVPNQDMMEAIYGQLFTLGAGGKILPDLATGYKFSPDAKDVTITLRQGVKFSDGTPFNAAAVIFNWNRDFGPLAQKAGISPTWNVARTNPKNPTSTPVKGAYEATGPYTLVVHQNIPNAAFIDQLFSSVPTWIASPTALAKKGEQAFAKSPVGAGPFVAVSNAYSNQFVVKRNPTYWQAPQGLPYLDQITFKTVGSDEAAIEAMTTGEGQVGGVGEPQLINEAKQKFQVLEQPGTSPYDLQLNTAIPPFNNSKARQAIYAATDFGPILQHVFGNLFPPVQGFTGPGGICYQQYVPGYQGYNPTLAKQLVKQSGLDKVTINFGTIQTAVAQETTQALSDEWKQFGIKTTLQVYPLNGLIQAFEKNNGKWWQAMIQTAGAFDPAGSVGVEFRFSSTSPFSGVHDPALDKIIYQAQGVTEMSKRCDYYHQAQEYIAKHFYGPFYFSLNPIVITAKGIGGPGLTSPLPAIAVGPTVPWESVWYNPSS